MNESLFLKDLKGLLATNLDITLDTDLLDIDEWDSYSAMSFLSMVKEKYDIKIEPFEVAEAILVEDLYNIVDKNRK